MRERQWQRVSVGAPSVGGRPIRHDTIAGAAMTSDCGREARWFHLHCAASADPAWQGCAHCGNRRLRAGGEEVPHPAAAPPPRAWRDLCGGEIGLRWIWRSSGDHLHDTPLSMSGASANKNLTYDYRL
uniref:Uncharacterized protein n=1 Tax=Oryza nivara TaxID=4536 RepID=A0A0E0GXF9_ORYNI